MHKEGLKNGLPMLVSNLKISSNRKSDFAGRLVGAFRDTIYKLPQVFNWPTQHAESQVKHISAQGLAKCLHDQKPKKFKSTVTFPLSEVLLAWYLC